MGMSADEQSKFVRENLGPAFRDSGIKSKILVFDHNCNQIEFPVTVLDDTKAAACAAGTAIHCYGGTVTAQSEPPQPFLREGHLAHGMLRRRVAERQTASGSDGFDHRRNAELGQKRGAVEPRFGSGTQTLSGWMQYLPRRRQDRPLLFPHESNS